MDESFFESVMKLNVTSTFLTSKFVVPYMREGSWLTPSSAIHSGAYAEISRLAAEAVAISRKAKG